MDRITIDIRAEQVLASMTQRGRELDAALVRVLNRLRIEVQAAVKSTKLSGQVLHVRTGTLRRSINSVLVETPQGAYAQVGTNVVYAAAHEYGFQGTTTVRAHVRHLVQGSGKGKTSSEVNVRQHARAVNLPERSYLRSTLADWAQRIRDGIKAAVLGALK